MKKYIDYPVGTYSGTTPISIPIYEIESGDITMPIVLNYHSGGVIVGDEASWVGLNWSLSAPGVINQQIRGTDDFSNNGLLGINTPPMIDLTCGSPVLPNPSVPDGANGFCAGHESIGNISEARSTHPTVGGQIIQNDGRYSLDAFDWEPDLFTFSFSGYAGQFIFDQNGKPYMLEQQNLLIDERLEEEDLWKITTSQGLVYTFSRSEIETNLTVKVGESWYLTKIASTSGSQEVTFQYDELPTVGTHKDFSFSHAVTMSGNSDPLGLGSNAREQRRMYAPVYLKTITFDGGRIEFDRNLDGREDLQGEQYLQYIRIYSQQNGLVKEYELEMEYLEAIEMAPNPLVTYATPEDRDFDYKRLILKSISERGGSTVLKTEFEYDNTSLPQKTSFARDFWGYYNGKANGTLLPSLKKAIAMFGTTVLYNLQGADRRASTDAKAGVLTSIKYPTGGSTSFEYELNSYANEEAQLIEKSYSTRKQVYIETGGQENVFSDPPIIAETSLEQIQTGFIEISADCQSCSGLPSPSYIRIKSNNLPVSSISLNNLSATYPSQTTEQSSGGFYSLFFRASLSTFLTAGGNLEFYIDSPDQGRYNIRLIVRKNELVTQTRTLGGGLRLAKKTDADPLGVSMVTRLLYEDEQGSWGKIMRSPQFYRTVPIPESPNTYVLQFASSSVTQPAGSAGGNVGYSKVVILHGANGEFGKAEHFYHNVADQVFEHFIRPPSIPAVPHELNGRLGKVAIYAFEDNNYKLLKEEINVYELGLKVLVKCIAREGATSIGFGNVIERLHYYPFYSSWVRLKRTESISYDNNTLSLVKNFGYNEIASFSSGAIYVVPSAIPASEWPVHFNPRKISTTFRDGSIQEVRFNYPNDYLTPSSSIQQLLQHNIDDIAIEEAVYRNDLLTKLNTKTFAYNSDLDKLNLCGVGEIVIANAIDNYTSSADGATFDSRVKEMSKVYEFDSRGNPLEVSRSNDVHTVFIYGFGERLPIARIVDATLSDVTSILSAGDLAALKGSSLSDAQISTLVDQIRLALPRSQVTTYTYVPGVGINSTTDPNNMTTYYEYDDFGRLKLVRDHNGNILTTYKYHYSSQP
ncbi:MAG TPA: hypothetical protein VK658_00750 [Chryseolinea sp.]|nr:hypothetical protein [Chryseolinea sp.]